MSLIPCDQSCKHQQEGYCTLNQISRLTAGIHAKCGYYEAGDGTERPTANALLSYEDYLPKN